MAYRKRNLHAGSIPVGGHEKALISKTFHRSVVFKKLLKPSRSLSDVHVHSGPSSVKVIAVPPFSPMVALLYKSRKSPPLVRLFPVLPDAGNIRPDDNCVLSGGGLASIFANKLPVSSRFQPTVASHILNPSQRMSRQNQQISWRCVFSSRDCIRILGRDSVGSISISPRVWTRENGYPPLQLTHSFAPSPARTVKHCTVVVFVGQYTYNKLASICTSRMPPFGATSIFIGT